MTMLNFLEKIYFILKNFDFNQIILILEANNFLIIILTCYKSLKFIRKKLLCMICFILNITALRVHSLNISSISNMLTVTKYYIFNMCVYLCLLWWQFMYSESFHSINEFEFGKNKNNCDHRFYHPVCFG